ncbi:MAG: PepSY domain-containing protein [Sphingomicrobium sp.]
MRRWHAWLAWLVGIPILVWTLSGFVMAARPIAEVRGEALLRTPHPMALAASPVLPQVAGIPLKSLSLEPRADGPRWVAALAGSAGSRLADPATGAWLPRLDAAEAAREVSSRYTGSARVVAVERITADHRVVALRKGLDGWRVRMSDDTHFYVDRGSGEIVATRTRFWRFYDFMWGIHIMDLQWREDPHNPWIVMLSAIALVLIASGFALLPTLRRLPVSPPPAAEPPAAPTSRRRRRPR